MSGVAEVVEGSVRGRTVRVRCCGSEGAPAVYCPMHGDAAEGVMEACAALGCPPFDLVAVTGLDWGGDLSPWPCEPVSAPGDGFTGGADAFAGFLEDSAVPFAEGVLGAPPERVVAGYSMAGLFALYVPYVSEMFSRCVSASGSLWYPGFADFVERSVPVRTPESVYLSLGDREHRTRNPVLSTVAECTGRVRAAMERRGAEVLFESNPGNHFRDADLRLAKGIAWTLAGALGPEKHIMYHEGDASP